MMMILTNEAVSAGAEAVPGRRAGRSQRAAAAAAQRAALQRACNNQQHNITITKLCTCSTYFLHLLLYICASIMFIHYEQQCSANLQLQSAQKGNSTPNHRVICSNNYLILEQSEKINTETSKFCFK